MAETVCVTGGTGFVGHAVVEAFLTAGDTVHAPVRDPGRPGALAALGAAHPGRLRLFAADLLRPGSYAEAIAGCGVVVHTAAVARLTAQDPAAEIVRPAVEGTANVLDSVAAVGGVRRVVLTSSVAAIGGYASAGERLHEGRWNDAATVAQAPYEHAKTQAERLAWARAAAAGGAWDLVSINPAMVLGPVADRAHLRASPVIVKDVLAGTFPGCPRLWFGVVDSREVAAAHVAAAKRPEAIGRYLLAAGGMWFREMAALLRPLFPGRPIPRWDLPDWLMLVGAAFDKRVSVRTMREMLGVALQYDGARAERELGIVYRPPAESVEAAARSMVDAGWLGR